MSTGSIFKSIEIMQKHDAEQLITAVEKSDKAGRERGMRLIDADTLTPDMGDAEIENGTKMVHYSAACIQKAPTVDAAPEWISVEDRPPKDRKSVNVVVEHKREDGKIFRFVMTASHIGHHEIEAEEWPDYDGDTEYDEENDCFWIPENWYEDNFMEDNMNYLICDEYRVTHWMPLPSTEGLDDAT